MRKAAGLILLGQILSVGLLMLSGPAPASAAPVEIYDRTCTAVGGWDYIINHMPIGEAFVPRLGTLTTVEVYVENKYGSPSPLTLKIREGSITGPVLASKGVVIGPGAKGWVAFHFSPALEVDPGSTYVIELVTSRPIVWYTTPASCPDGQQRITDGHPWVNAYMFKTKGYKPDFQVGLNATEITLRQGEAVHVEVTLTPLYRAEGDVPLAVSPDLSEHGLTMEFSDDEPFMDPEDGASVVLTITASEDADVDDYDVSVAGTLSGFWGFVSEQADLTVHVEEAPRDFEVQISPSGRTVEAGSSTTFTVEVTPIGNFDQTVHLSVTGLPEGATYEFSRTSGVPPFSSTLTVSTQTSTPEGTYLLTVTGSGGGKAHTATTHLTVEVTVEPDFSISVSPSSRTVTAGEVAEYSIQITPTAGFSAPITVSLEGLPPDATFEVTQTGAYAATLRVQTGETSGSFVLTITASGGGKTHSATVNLVVNPGAPTTTPPPTTTAPPTTPPAGRFDFSISISPARVTVSPGDTVTFSVTVQAISGTPQPVTLTVTGLPSDASYHISPDAVTPTGGATLEVMTGSTTGSFTLVVTGSAAGVTRSATATLLIQEQPVPSRCVIATAAYGSEMAPQVQMLREFRDRVILETFSGASFMRAFNAFYYSWSPPVAEFIRDRPNARLAVRASLAPMLWSLSISKGVVEVMGGPSELSVALAGILASALIGALYLTLPVYAALRAAGVRVRRGWVEFLGTAWGASAAALAVGTALRVSAVTIPASASLVLLTISASPTLIAAALQRLSSPRG